MMMGATTFFSLGPLPAPLYTIFFIWRIAPSQTVAPLSMLMSEARAIEKRGEDYANIDKLHIIIPAHSSHSITILFNTLFHSII